jgi:hypothetical protein
MKGVVWLNMKKAIRRYFVIDERCGNIVDDIARH